MNDSSLTPYRPPAEVDSGKPVAGAQLIDTLMFALNFGVTGLLLVASGAAMSSSNHSAEAMSGMLVVIPCILYALGEWTLHVRGPAWLYRTIGTFLSSLGAVFGLGAVGSLAALVFSSKVPERAVAAVSLFGFGVLSGYCLWCGVRRLRIARAMTSLVSDEA